MNITIPYQSAPIIGVSAAVPTFTIDRLPITPDAVGNGQGWIETAEVTGDICGSSDFIDLVPGQYSFIGSINKRILCTDAAHFGQTRQQLIDDSEGYFDLGASHEIYDWALSIGDHYNVGSAQEMWLAATEYILAGGGSGFLFASLQGAYRIPNFNGKLQDFMKIPVAVTNRSTILYQVIALRTSVLYAEPTNFEQSQGDNSLYTQKRFMFATEFKPRVYTWTQ